MNKKSVKYESTTFTAQIGVFAKVLDFDSDRNMLAIQNKGADDVYIYLGDAASATEAKSILVKSGGLLELFVTPSNEISAAVDSAGSGTCVLYVGTSSVVTSIDN